MIESSGICHRVIESAATSVVRMTVQWFIPHASSARHVTDTKRPMPDGLTAYYELPIKIPVRKTSAPPTIT